MLVQDILDIIKLRSSNVALSKNDAALIKFIYLGVSELYRQFNLSIKSESVAIISNQSIYNLKNPDVSMLLEVFDTCGRSLKNTDVIDSYCWEIKQLNYKSFALNHPFDGWLYAVYKACPARFSDADDIIDIPDAMIDALLSYVTYMIHSTVSSVSSVLSRGGTSETVQYFQQFKAACQELENNGYRIPLNAETLSIYARGGYI